VKALLLVVVVACAPAPSRPEHPLRLDRMKMSSFEVDGSADEPIAGLDRLAVIALRDQARTIRGFDGFRVVIANASDVPIVLPASDYAVDMVQEAIDRSGNWAPIESVPLSTCGNSFMELTLAPDQAWELRAPDFDGDFPTELRLRLDTAFGPVYSNEWDGRVDVAQFAQRDVSELVHDR
jgi:hypothetical protein